ncbi:hypothetical protein NDU88_001052 [Pleurodeles waltl]|uniref:Uncharacterized protein n=1 Tax=Pleurodeles waltl TaxID=8319 RepID=A0AAV7WKS6_PLEWA|nr:hypothetical protein NDU88_001052 [Pleurodeles waltl]
MCFPCTSVLCGLTPAWLTVQIPRAATTVPLRAEGPVFPDSPLFGCRAPEGRGQCPVLRSQSEPWPGAPPSRPRLRTYPELPAASPLMGVAAAHLHQAHTGRALLSPRPGPSPCPLSSPAAPAARDSNEVGSMPQQRPPLRSPHRSLPAGGAFCQQVEASCLTQQLHGLKNASVHALAVYYLVPGRNNLAEIPKSAAM